MAYLSECNHGESVVVYNCKTCPLCEAQDELTDLEKRLESLQEDSAYFEEKSIELEDQLTKLRKEIENG